MSLELLTSCPVCSTGDFDPHLEVKDHSVSHGTFQIVRCKNCNFLFTNPRPTEASIGVYYHSASYISHHDEPQTLLSKVYGQVRKIAVNDKINLVSKYNERKHKSILDIGCGTGFFLSACKQRGWSTSGTEPDGDARKTASSRIGVQICSSIFDEEMKEKHFSTITMWHVLEHVHRLDETLSWIHEHLEKNGTLIVAVPNAQSHDAKVFGPYWAAYDVPRHLYHFDQASMASVLARHDFKIFDIKPMIFDSYYVSLLSNKYKHGSSKMVSSFFTGSLSNIKGLNTNHDKPNTSSLIYVIRKNNTK